MSSLFFVQPAWVYFVDADDGVMSCFFPESSNIKEIVLHQGLIGDGMSGSEFYYDYLSDLR